MFRKQSSPTLASAKKLVVTVTEALTFMTLLSTLYRASVSTSGKGFSWVWYGVAIREQVHPEQSMRNIPMLGT